VKSILVAADVESGDKELDADLTMIKPTNELEYPPLILNTPVFFKLHELAKQVSCRI
jgi:hypothetical protein